MTDAIRELGPLRVVHGEFGQCSLETYDGMIVATINRELTASAFRASAEQVARDFERLWNPTLSDIQKETVRARHKFPSNRHMLAALGEEHGELSNALIEHEFGNGSPQDVYDEAIQVATCAIRVAEEGDPSFRYNPEEVR